MTGKEYLWAYCQLKLHGYSHEEAQEIIEEIKVKMITDDDIEKAIKEARVKD